MNEGKRRVVPTAIGTAIGTADWTRRTGGRLTREERRALLRPLLRSHVANLAGRTRLAVRRHPGRRRTVDAGAFEVPDSRLAREATRAAADLVSTAVLNHSLRSYAWGSALGTIEGLTFDRELLYLAAMLHDTGLPTPVDGIDFTVGSADLARAFADEHGLDAARYETLADAVCLHHTPGVTLERGPEAYLMSAGAAVDVFGMRAWDLPDAVRAEVVRTWPRLGFKTEFARLLATEAARVPHGRAWFLHRYALSDLTIRAAPFTG